MHVVQELRREEEENPSRYGYNQRHPYSLEISQHGRTPANERDIHGNEHQCIGEQETIRAMSQCPHIGSRNIEPPLQRQIILAAALRIALRIVGIPIPRSNRRTLSRCNLRLTLTERQPLVG